MVLIFLEFQIRTIVFIDIPCPGQLEKQQANQKCKIIQVFQEPWLIDPLLNIIWILEK